MKVVVVDDERIIRVALVDELRDSGYEVKEFTDAITALSDMRNFTPDIVISDLKMPKMDGIEFLKNVQKHFPGTFFILMTAYSTVTTAVEAMRLGAYDYITKPFNNDELLILIERIIELKDVKEENKYLRHQIVKKFKFSSFIGESLAIKEVFNLIKIVANKDTTVLITGETGTGKELLTKVIHYNSERSKKPLIKVSCAILSQEIFESEMFGHVKGAFTGAENDKIGRFELANSGTLYLDDIDDVPLNMQVKLLRAIEEREIERVGGKEAIKIDIRIIASTKKDLRKLVNEGKFREDLFYRLNVFPINIPPLRERVSDIPLIINHFIKQFSNNIGISIDNEVLEQLKSYPFPGNTRELKNLTERLVLLSQNNKITKEIIPVEIKCPSSSIAYSSFENKPLPEIIEGVERDLIMMAMKRAENNKTKAAELLGIPVTTFKSKLIRFSE